MSFCSGFMFSTYSSKLINSSLLCEEKKRSKGAILL
uniref:Heat shock protein, putative n=1 Tax=Arundo donax TaxID=35708 RepID=A0A0A9EX39_ARUDO